MNIQKKGCDHLKSYEKFVSINHSDYFVSLPSTVAQSTFFYPLCMGHFLYEPGYSLRRDAYDSFLLMYVQNGELTLEYDTQKERVKAGSFVLLDCYKLHAYYSDTGWESLWLHFDGPVARGYYDLIVSQFGHVFSLSNPYSVLNKLERLYQTFRNGEIIKEASLSKIITDILTALLSSAVSVSDTANHADVMEEMISYIHEHFAENISVPVLANRASMSQYHFIRVFKQKTSFTPHEYIRNIRLSTAKYLLKTSPLSVKDICFRTGFSCESVFCTAFKKKTGMTPEKYRQSASDNSYKI